MLVGRAEERQQIARLLDEARSGRSGALAFVGEPGIGKSALLAFGVESATGFQVLSARGVESEAHIPFSSLLELLRPALGCLGRIPKPQAVALESALALRPGRPAERFAVGAGTLSLLAAMGEQGPVMVVLDDAHWLDASSAEALRFAARRLVADPIAILVAVREGEPSLLDGSGLPTRHLGGLAVDEAAVLLAGPAGAVVSPELTDRACRATGGNPLALLELAKGVDLLHFLHGGGTSFPVPAAISNEFLHRAGSLDEAASRLLILAATHDDGDAVTVERAAGVLGLDFAALRQAETAGLITLKEGRVEFRHPLVRSAVYRAAPPDARRDAHRALASVMSDRDADRRAWHLASAAVGTDASASVAMSQAGERANERSAYAVAAGAFERAAGLAVDDHDRGNLLFQAAKAAWLAGLAGLSRTLLSRSRMCTGDPARIVELAHLEGEIALHAGPVMDGFVVLADAAASAEADYAVELLAEASIACLYAGRPAEMLETADRARSLLSAASSPEARFLAGMSRGMALILGGDAEHGSSEIRQAALLAETTGISKDPRFTAWLVMVPAWLRESVTARATVDRALETARARSAVGDLPFLLNHLARDQAGGQEWAAAQACYEESVQLSRETGQGAELAAALAGSAWLEARLGREEPCREHAAEAAELCLRLGMGLFETWVHAALGELELSLGHASQAAEHFEQQAQLLASRGITDPDVSPAPELADAYLRLGRRVDAEHITDRFEADAVKKGQAWSLARARRGRGLVAGEGDFERYFEQALRFHQETPDAFELGRTYLAYGARLRRARRRANARARLREAMEIFERLGAWPWSDAARAELVATGETIGARTAGGLQRLTSQEIQVAVLLARGASIREAAAALFVSPKTVEYHLRHVYQKLGVHSRDELAVALGDLTQAVPR
jgi:DNA-binding CsgD family transcriptional regulator